MELIFDGSKLRSLGKLILIQLILTPANILVHLLSKALPLGLGVVVDNFELANQCLHFVDITPGHLIPIRVAYACNELGRLGELQRIGHIRGVSWRYSTECACKGLPNGQAQTTQKAPTRGIQTHIVLVMIGGASIADGALIWCIGPAACCGIMYVGGGGITGAGWSMTYFVTCLATTRVYACLLHRFTITDTTATIMMNAIMAAIITPQIQPAKNILSSGQ